MNYTNCKYFHWISIIEIHSFSQIVKYPSYINLNVKIFQSKLDT